MRLYTFCNSYLSSIQQGIQTAHVVHELFNKYIVTSCTRALQLNDWSHNHKTIIVLNGGANNDIHEIHDFLDDSRNNYPFACFEEDETSLGGVMTCAGIILPEKIYSAAEKIRQKTHEMIQYRSDHVLCCIENGIYRTDVVYSAWELKLIDMLNSCGLAK